MSDVETLHWKDGEQQITRRTVVLEDAAGHTTRYEFLETGEGHEYQGDDEPTERALEALEEHLEGVDD